MKQYIDKAAVVAEIEKRKNENLECETKVCRGSFGARAMEDIDILSFLDTLEVKEMSNIWHTISDRDVDLPKAGDVICFIKNGRVISGEYRLNKFYGKVNNGYDNPIEKGDKWCSLSDILRSVVEVKEVDLDKEFERFLNEVEGVPRMWHSDEQIEWAKDLAKHFFELGLKAQKGE